MSLFNNVRFIIRWRIHISIGISVIWITLTSRVTIVIIRICAGRFVVDVCLLVRWYLRVSTRLVVPGSNSFFHNIGIRSQRCLWFLVRLDVLFAEIMRCLFMFVPIFITVCIICFVNLYCVANLFRCHYKLLKYEGSSLKIGIFPVTTKMN